MDLHGVKTVEVNDGTGEISVVNVSIIGIVGTADNSAGSTDATLTTGSPLLSNEVKLTAAGAGQRGNSVRLVMLAGLVSAALGVTYTLLPDGSTQLSIQLATDATGASTSTATTVAAAINAASLPASVKGEKKSELLTSVAVTSAIKLTAAVPATSGTGTGIVQQVDETYLAGGSDEPFPAYTPSLIAGNKKKALRLGTTGTLPGDTTDILNQVGALIVVVRVPSNADPAIQQQNIMQGIQALTGSKQILTVTPRVLIAPDFSTNDQVGKQLEVVANQLRGVCYLDSPSAATAASVVQRRALYGGRVEILRPRVKTLVNANIYRPYSATAAGLRARVDNENGYWWSKSNQGIYGVTGLEQIDDFIIGEENCTANLLNQSHVSTIILDDGYRHWGNRLCNADPQWSFEAVRRTADVIEDSLAIAAMRFVDRPIDKIFAEDLLDTANSFIREQTELGAINGGKAWLDPDLNTKESLAAGKIYLNVDFAPKSPAEQITITYRINNDYTVDQIALVMAA